MGADPRPRDLEVVFIKRALSSPHTTKEAVGYSLFFRHHDSENGGVQFSNMYGARWLWEYEACVVFSRCMCTEPLLCAKHQTHVLGLGTLGGGRVP